MNEEKVTARVIVTLDCNRNCDYCCNTEAILEEANVLDSYNELLTYDEVCITGGEPSLAQDVTGGLIDFLYSHDSRFKTYLYTARWDNIIIDWLPILDGIHYTIHAEDGEREFRDFKTCQSILPAYPELSRRLCIVHGYRYSVVPLDITAWDHMDMRDFTPDKPLPTHEDLYILPGIRNG